MNKKLLKRRYRRERYLRYCGIACISGALLFLVLLLGIIVNQGWRAFLSATIQLELTLDPAVIGVEGDASPLKYQKIIKEALLTRFPQVNKRSEKKQLYSLLSFASAIQARDYALAHPDKLGTQVTLSLPAASAAERYLKGAIDLNLPAKQRGISELEISWLEALRDGDETAVGFNWKFFTAADSRDAELAGVGSALRGSFYSLLLSFMLSFPIGVLSAIYLELFAPRNRWFDIVEININNLAAVPSIIFGLLGLAVFINFFQLPRSSSLVGGLVLSLMTLPTVVIASRAALSAVPPSLLAGALSLGATKMQGVFHHVLPNAIPGILTGVIIGMARALGETAPLLMIGMVAFIVELPQDFADAATALPVQIFLWADSPERGFVERTSAAIIVLLVFLLAMNAVAIYIRNKMEKNGRN